MTNKTPPAWVTRIAEDNHNINTGGMSYRQAIHERELLVMAHTPDAEALAEALEQAITNCKGASEYGHGMNLTVVHGSCCSEPRAALAAYRARFPKVKVTP